MRNLQKHGKTPTWKGGSAIMKLNNLSKDKPQNSKINKKKYCIKKVWNYVSEYKIYVFVIFVFAVLESLSVVFGPKFTGSAITLLSEGNIDFDYLFEIIMKMLLIFSVYALSSCLGSYFVSIVTIKLTYRLRNDISDKMDKLSFEYINSVSYGDVLSRIMNDVDSLSSAFTQSISRIVSSVVMAVGVLVMMISISLKMTLTFIAVLPLVGIVVAIILKKSQKYFDEYQKQLGEIDGFIEEAFSGHEVVSIFNAEEKFKNNFSEINRRMYDSSQKSQFLSGIAPCIVEIVSKASYIVSCIMGGYLAVMKLLSIGDITAFIAYSNQFMDPVIQVTSVSGIIQQIVASSQRIFEFLEAPEETQNDSENLDMNIDSAQTTEIEFKNVSFGYTPEKKIIKDFSLKVKAGQTLAIVGETGSGKTTLINILMRFLENFEGEILLGGKNIKSFSLKKYRKLFGLVTQDSWLYSGTIYENIAYGKENFSENEIKLAAASVGASHFIESLPEGYNTVIAENMYNISEGQKQLLCIARMILKNAPIFIMDEATSSVDVFTESRIQSALKKILKNKTSIVIAHRLSTIKNADIVAVMEKGELVEIGTHDKLMSKEGIYFSMYMSQFDKV